jgi:hypothetical protein
MDPFSWGNPDNLVINEGDPWSKYIPPRTDNGDPMCTEIPAGRWYQEAYDACITDPEKQFFFPFVVYADKTGKTKGQRSYNGTPILISPALFTTSFRLQPEAWRVISFMSDMDKRSSADRGVMNRTKAGHGVRMKHKAINVSIESWKTSQASGGPVLPVGMHGSYKFMHIISPLCMIIGDGESQFHMCSNFGASNASRISRMCQTTGLNMHNPYHECTFVGMSTHQRLCDALRSDPLPSSHMDKKI